jgi:urate oxidase
MKLSQAIYGKAQLRVMKVTRDNDRHSLKELEISILLKGNFEASYTQGDNSLVVPTDTMKNTVNVLAKEKLGGGNEEFGIVIGQHFLGSYEQIEHVEVRLSEQCWQRMRVQSRPHPHSFVAGGGTTPVVTVRAGREQITVTSGIEDLLILKTAEAGFQGFATDQYTTLRETRDQLLATKLKADWTYQYTPTSYSEANAVILNSMIEVFAANYSPSLQRTLFQMGEAALNAVPEISHVHLTLPNKHCVLVDLAPFGLENQNEVYSPIDGPHGEIEGTVTRD